MASQAKATFDKNAATRTKYNIEEVENNVHHHQWVTRHNRSNWAQVDSEAYTPDSARKTFEKSVSSAAAVVAKQKADEAASNAAVAKSQANAAAATFSKKKGVVAARMDQSRGEAKVSRNSRGWRLVWPPNSLAETPDE